MPWKVEWVGGGEPAGPFSTEWDALRFALQVGRRLEFRIVDQAPVAGLIHTMLEEHEARDDWKRVASFLAPHCDRFWLHWWFRKPNDSRSLMDQLLDPAGRPAPEPLPERSALGLGWLDWVIDQVEHSWICPNGVAVSGPLVPGTLDLLLSQDPVSWWDLHLCSQGRILFTATDGGTEHFAWLTDQEIASMVAAGLPDDLFRRLQ